MDFGAKNKKRKKKRKIIKKWALSLGHLEKVKLETKTKGVKQN